LDFLFFFTFVPVVNSDGTVVVPPSLSFVSPSSLSIGTDIDDPDFFRSSFSDS